MDLCAGTGFQNLTRQSSQARRKPSPDAVQVEGQKGVGGVRAVIDPPNNLATAAVHELGELRYIASAGNQPLAAAEK